MESESHDAESAKGTHKRPSLAGVEVREEDLIAMPGLNFVAVVFKVSAVIILALALWQFVDWWTDRPPDNVGMAFLIADTIKLIVISALLWAASSLARLMIRSHYDLRASRILLARQTYVQRQMAIHSGALPVAEDSHADRRGVDPDHSSDGDHI